LVSNTQAGKTKGRWKHVSEQGGPKNRPHWFHGIHTVALSVRDAVDKAWFARRADRSSSRRAVRAW